MVPVQGFSYGLGSCYKKCVVADIKFDQCPDGRKIYQGSDRGIFLYVPALGEEGSEHDCPRSLQSLATKVCFGHGALNGDWLAVVTITADGELRHRPNGTSNISKVGHWIFWIFLMFLHLPALGNGVGDEFCACWPKIIGADVKRLDCYVGA